VSFRSGLLHDAETDTLYSLEINNGTLTEIPLSGAKMVRKSPCGQRPYDIVRGRGGKLLYVSDWAARAVLAVDAKELRVVAKIAVGEHPNQMAVHPKDDRLFVACASSNCVSVIDTKRGIVTETIMTSLFPKAPEGTTPDALALALDGKVLYVA
jgi:YVTN family beta-propeller protein